MVLLAAATAPVIASPVTWDGGGLNDNWTNPVNWVGDQSPANDGSADVHFGAASRRFPVLGGTQSVNSISFGPENDFTFQSPGSLTVGAGGLTNGGAKRQTFASPLVVNLGADQAWNTGLGGVSVAGTLNLAGVNAEITATGAPTLLNAVTGTGTLRLHGGVVDLGAVGTSAYAGSLVVAQNATLRTGQASALGAHPFTLDGGTLQHTPTTTAAITRGIVLGAAGGTIVPGSTAFASRVAGEISGEGMLTKSGANTLVLAGTNTYQGGTRITGGVLNAETDAALGSGPIVLAGGTFTGGKADAFEDFLFTDKPLTIENDSRLVGTIDAVLFNGLTSGPGKLTLTGGSYGFYGPSTRRGPTIIDAAHVAVTDSAFFGGHPLTMNGGSLALAPGVFALPITLGAAAQAPSIAIDFFTSLSSTTLSGRIEGVGAGLRKDGDGTLVLSAANAIPGKFSVARGTLRLEHDQALAGTGLEILSSSARAEFASPSPTMGALNGKGTVHIASGTSLRLSGGSFTGTFEGDGKLVVGVGGLAVTPSFGTAFRHTGGTVVDGGTLAVHPNQANISATLQNQGTFHVSLPAGTPTEPVFVAPRLTGAGKLKLGTTQGAFLGSVQITSENQHTGGTELVSATLLVSNDAALGLAVSPLIFTSASSGSPYPTLLLKADYVSPRPISLNGTAIIDTAGFNATLSGVVTGLGSLNKRGAGSLSLAGPMAPGGATTVVSEGDLIVNHDLALGDRGLNVQQGARVFFNAPTPSVNSLQGQGQFVIQDGSTLSHNPSGTILFDGQITGAGKFRAGKGSTWLRNTNNTYSGGTVVANASLLAIAPGSLGPGPIELINGTLTLSYPSIDRPIKLAGDSNQINDRDYPVATVNGVLSGDGGITQFSGVVNLAADNTYTGPTSVRTIGTINVTGSVASQIATVSAGGKLLGSGRIAGTVTVAAGGIFGPSGLRAGGLTLEPDSNLTLGLGGSIPSTDVVIAPGGPLNLLGGTVNVASFSGLTTGDYPLIRYDGPVGGDFANLSLGTLPFGATAELWHDPASRTIGVSVTPDHWTRATGGDWLDPTNWSGPLPNGPTAEAYLLDNLAGPASLALGSPTKLSVLRIASDHPYTVQGPGTLTFGEFNSPPSTINVIRGRHAFATEVVMGHVPMTLDVWAGAALRFGNVNSGVGPIEKVGAGEVTFAGAQDWHFNRTQLNVRQGVVRFESGPDADLRLALDEGATAVLAAPVQRFDRITTAAEVLALPGRRVVSTRVLSMLPGGVFDLSDNVLVVGPDTTTATFLAVESAIAAARNAEGGLWAGAGITSSMALEQPHHGLALLRNDNGAGGTLLTSINGFTLLRNHVVVAYTLDGDSDLNGVITVDDYARLDRGFLMQKADPAKYLVYRFGDFDYDNAIDLDDYALIDAAFLAQPASQLTPVPEASAVSLFALPLVFRRRRKHVV